MAIPASDPGAGVPVPVTTPATTESGDLGAPLYIAWQVTNECNLACLHCIEESGPGKAFHDESGAIEREALAFIADLRQQGLVED